MFPVLKNKYTLPITWRPSASLDNLRERAKILQKIRTFFAERNVLEVETPILCQTSVTDPHIQSIKAFPIEKRYLNSSASAEESYFLQTSPEYAMKRLLAAGSGAIYQITKAFRQGEIGKVHNPEFTLLEWYRPDFNEQQLMAEVDELLQQTIQTEPAEKKSYAEIFQTHLNIDPHQATWQELKHCAIKQDIYLRDNMLSKDTWLDLLMTHCIEPHLGHGKPCFIYDYPASQAALAKISKDNPNVAQRFELYVNGMELANGFHELTNATEQRERFEKNMRYRKTHDLAYQAIDEFFLAALTHGLPNCSGVALGIDRLIMLAIKSNDISDVLSFDFSRI